jgi:hypothetical protein
VIQLTIPEPSFSQKQYERFWDEHPGYADYCKGFYLRDIFLEFARKEELGTYLEAYSEHSITRSHHPKVVILFFNVAVKTYLLMLR